MLPIFQWLGLGVHGALSVASDMVAKSFANTRRDVPRRLSGNCFSQKKLTVRMPIKDMTLVILLITQDSMRWYICLLISIERTITAMPALGKHNPRRCLGNIRGAVDGYAHLRLLEGWGIVDAVSCHAHHASLGLQGLDYGKLVLGIDSGHSVGCGHSPGTLILAQVLYLGRG